MEIYGYITVYYQAHEWKTSVRSGQQCEISRQYPHPKSFSLSSEESDAWQIHNPSALTLDSFGGLCSVLLTESTVSWCKQTTTKKQKL